ncbi:amino acid adenylation domain-containing protein [Kribbella sp. NBC_00482]|uniref:non-ribosomal peptide synthetase n=1 Tax=Kribbella sp. NBC_00482 TaxID=2975968 RepID=UPI002E1794DD
MDVELNQEAQHQIDQPDPTRAAAHLPATSAQQRLWFLQNLAPDACHYNVNMPLRVRGDLNIPVLTEALREIYQRHDVLRTRFHLVDDQLVQAIGTDDSPQITHERLTTVAGRTAESQLVEAAQIAAMQPFDLETGPLMRASVLTLTAEDHAILLSFHHMVCDGVSVGIIARELEELYAANVESRPHQLPASPLQYAEVTRHAGGWVGTDDYRDRLEDLVSRLQGLSPTTVPSRLMRSEDNAFHGNHFMLWMNAGLSERTRDFCRRESLTVFQLFVAVMSVLFARRSEQSDVAFGSAMSGRLTENLESVVGCFVNTVVLRNQLDLSESFRDVIRRTREVLLQAHEDQEIPFERVVERIAPRRLPGVNPLFRVMLDFQGVRRATWNLPGLEIETMDVETYTSQFDLKFMFIDDGSRISCGIEYNTDLYSTDTIASLASQLETLLRSILEAPERPLAELPIMKADDAARLLELSVGPVETVPPESALERFTQSASALPKSSALRMDSTSLSYADLDDKSSHLARHLGCLGVEAGDLVGICLPRSFDMVIAALGVWKAGAAYVPMDPASPVERLGAVAAEANLRGLITWTDVAVDFDESRTVYLDSGWDEDTAEDADGVPARPADDALAYVIYTSGTTGVPKGVEITHSSLSNYLDWCRRSYPLEAGETVIVHTGFAFDLTVTTLVHALASGAELRLAFDGPGVEPLVHELRSTEAVAGLKLTPGQLQLLTEEVDGNEVAGKVGWLVLGGENLRQDHGVAWWRKHDPATAIFNEYGPSEATVGCVVHRLSPADLDEQVAIGRPIQNMSAFVLDQQLRMVPPGVAGELYLAGAGLARGYHGRPEWTAEAFRTASIDNLGEVRVYRTGDLACWDVNGNLEYLGRTDRQVKIRGYRVELGEIESALGSLPDAGQVAVTTSTGPAGSTTIVAYYSGLRRDFNELRRELSRRLPEYMQPQLFVHVDQLPLTRNGKIDYDALPTPEPEAGEPSSAGSAPEGEVEEAIHQIWADVLGRDSIPVDADFFDLGGESLLATQVMARMRRTFDIKLPLMTIFDAPTIKTLAETVSRHLAQNLDGDDPAGVTLTPDGEV